MKRLTHWVLDGVLGGVLGGVVFLAGCGLHNDLEDRQNIDRPAWGQQALPVRQPSTDELSTAIRALDGTNATTRAGTTVIPQVDDTISGTWDYTVPTTTTRVTRTTDAYDQASIYLGRPAPTEKPFLMISTRADVQSVVEASPAEYTVKATRTYLLNGQPCKETTGYTRKGDAFSEIIVKHSPTDQLQAIAIASSEEQRKTALEILASIKWSAKK